MKKCILGFIFTACILLTPLAFAQYHAAATSTNEKPQAKKMSDDEVFNAIDTHEKSKQHAKQQKEDNSIFALVSAEQEKQQAAGSFDPENVNDPLESLNRFTFGLNNDLDKAIAQPLAEAYVDIMPKPLNHGVNNFFINLENLPIVINDVLQGRFYQATSDVWRFFINSTAGIGGLVDVAKQAGLEQSYNDFGLTLAAWGWENSAYLVIPILGPGNIRDAFGRAINFFSLSAYTLLIKSFYLRWGLYGLSLLNTRAQLLKSQDLFNRAALDPYVFARDAYLQHRAFLIELNTKKRNPYTAAQTREFNNPMYIYQ